MRKTFLLIFSALILCSNNGIAKNKKIIEPDGTYMFAQKDGCELFMDIYEPDNRFREINGVEKPCILFMFGGGFTSGKRDEEFNKPWFKKLAENGYKVISIDYRLGLKGVKNVGFFKYNLIDNAIHIAVDDLYTATNFIIDNAEELGVNPNNIVLCGSSAGAISVLQAEYELANEREYASCLPKGFNYAGIISFSGAIFSRNGALKYKNEPCPTLLLHGTKDKIVEYKQIRFFNIGWFGSNTIAKVCKKKSYNYSIYRYEGLGHEIASIQMEAWNEVIRFIETNIMYKQKYIIDAKVTDPRIKLWKNQSLDDIYK